ncbi:MAG: ion transporter, partial [Clostridia bacterium]|nr:ion transporter [Clostridia bacterium]
VVYGDIFPITAMGKFLSAIIALLGIGLVAVPTGIISAGFIEMTEEKNNRQIEEEKKFCPYCGHEYEK